MKIFKNYLFGFVLMIIGFYVNKSGGSDSQNIDNQLLYWSGYFICLISVIIVIVGFVNKLNDAVSKLRVINKTKGN